MTSDELLKIAYAKGVSAALADAGMTKEAIFGGAIGRAAGWLGKKLIGGAGRSLTKGVSKISPRAGEAMRGAGRAFRPADMMRQGLGFGAIGSGAAAALAPEGQRWEAAKGAFIPGLLSGAGWSAGGSLSRLGVSRGVRAIGGSRGAMPEVRRAASRPWFTKKRLFNRSKAPHVQTPIVREMFRNPADAAKSVGAKALYKALPFGGAWAGAGLLAGDHEDETRIPAPVSAAIYQAGRRAVGGYGLTPQTQSYPSNYGQYQ